MTMLDFDFVQPTPRTPRTSRPLHVKTEEPTVAVVQTSPAVVETVTVTVHKTDDHAAHLSKDESSWGWEELRDFVVTEIEKRQGPIPRDFRKESGIFKSFLSRYGERAVPIAKVAFGPVFDGMWNSAPISVTRFCKGSDVYFADVIAKRL